MGYRSQQYLHIYLTRASEGILCAGAFVKVYEVRLWGRCGVSNGRQGLPEGPMRAMRSPTRAVPAQERRSCLSFPVILSRTVSVSPDQEYEATEKPSDR